MSKRTVRNSKGIPDQLGKNEIISQAFVLGVSLGSGAGIVFRLLWGSASGNIGAGLAIGMSMRASIGMSISFLVGYQIRSNNEKKQTQSTPGTRRRRLLLDTQARSADA